MGVVRHAERRRRRLCTASTIEEGPVYGRICAVLAIVTLALCAAACDDGNDTQAALDPTGTTVPAPPSTPTPTTAQSTSPPTTPTARPAVTPAPTVGRIDGTVAPQGFGGTDPVTVKSNPDPLQGTALLRDVRLGVHPEEGGWDRIVFEFDEDLPPGSIAYVPSVTACGSGAPVTVAGDAVLLVRFNQSAAHTDAGQPTIQRTTLQGAGDAILEARQICDFEGQVEWALGVDDRVRFKVTLLNNPRRVVIDIKQ
jgi:hypothetical protein